MSNPTTAASASSPVASAPTGASRALVIGLAGIGLTLAGLTVSSAHAVATSWLVGVAFWTAMALGMLLLVLIHHIFDASWSVVLRRQYEHGLSAFKWLLLLFLPLVVLSWTGAGDIVWPWMNLKHVMHGHLVGADPLYLKKSAFLNRTTFTVVAFVFFGLWIWLSSRLRKASFAQDADGDIAWTFRNRMTSAFGIPITALTLTGAAIYWLKSLEYHWFSTMYGVWFFANCMRGALSLGVLIQLWLYRRGQFKGILSSHHLHSIGQLMLAFTVFWAYVTFSQYFLIWNANVPEETFWYSIRENGDWYWVGMFLVFGNFLAPFLVLLSYRFKVTHRIIARIACFILTVIFVDLVYNILPALKDAAGEPLPFLSINLVWSLTSVVGVGGVCIWSYLRSLTTTKLIPIRDPRIGECLAHHE